ncbi:MAG: protein kinase [Labilithrix sp.]|nr:protein kinase [Labilithrix sp.]
MSAPAASTRYETLAVIGQGGMATVALGRARGAAGFTRLVAIKRAHVHLSDEAASMQREAALVSRLHHPNVVRVLDVVEDGAELVLVLDYVEGGSLADLVQRAADVGLEARTRTRAFVRILVDVAAGLDAAHRATDDDGRKLGLVHRDVSPSNVLVGTDGVARLTDFGIAKALEASRDRTDTGRLKGKIAYMAPEYVESQHADAYGDQFALGVVAWEALAGARLFRGPTEIETLKRVVAARVPSLAEIRSELAPLEPAIARALARRSGDRHASAEDFGAALEAAARKADLLASHAEVARLVETLLGDELERRRAAARGAGDSGAPSGPVASARDLVPTGSLAARPRADLGGGAVGDGAIGGREVAGGELVVGEVDRGNTAPTVVSMPALLRPRRRRIVGALLASLVALSAVAVALRLRGPAPASGERAAPVSEAAPASGERAAPVSEAAPASGERAAPVSEAAPASGERAAIELASDGAEIEPGIGAAASARAPAPRRKLRRPRAPAPSSSLVPKKAPPNPYLR